MNLSGTAAHSASGDGTGHALQAGLTPYHAFYFAHELTKRSASGSIDRLAGALADAQVDLNPHQLDAALFALSNPLSRGVILADEVGLGKTIEAGLLLSQRWAERQRRLLVIVPANLRKQWAQEMVDKFHLPSVILESKSFNLAIKSGNLNPFEQPALIICSYHFARSKDAYVKQTRWDLIVLDEAHRLRNVYKPSSRIAQSIKSAIEPYAKVLLTATPLQNSLLELFGLVSIVDEFVFGDVKSFRTQFVLETNTNSFASRTASTPFASERSGAKSLNTLSTRIVTLSFKSLFRSKKRNDSTSWSRLICNSLPSTHCRQASGR